MTGRRTQLSTKSAEIAYCRSRWDSANGPRVAPPNYVDGPTVVTALHHALAVTGDPIFRDAILAIKSYDLDKASPKKRLAAADENVQGDNAHAYLVQMRFLEERGTAPLNEEALPRLERTNKIRRYSSVQHAASRVAAEFQVPGHSFDAVVGDLRKAFVSWKRRNYPPAAGETNPGDVGRSIFVKPIGDLKIPLPDRPGVILPGSGLPVRDTLYWRRIFAEGSVEMRRVALE